MRITLDEMIEALQAKKAEGLPGETLVGIPERDNNGRHGYIKLDVCPRSVSVAKDEQQKGWTLCRTVTRGGLPVIVIG